MVIALSLSVCACLRACWKNAPCTMLYVYVGICARVRALECEAVYASICELVYYYSFAQSPTHTLLPLVLSFKKSFLAARTPLRAVEALAKKGV